MNVSQFYSLADQVKAALDAKGLLSGTDYNKFLQAAAKVGDHLVNGSGISPYTESTFWPAVEAVVTSWGKDPVNDMPARETALVGILYPLSAPSDILDNIITASSALIVSQEATDETLESSVQSLSGDPKYLILSVVASGVGAGEAAAIKILTSGDALNFVEKSVANVTADGNYEYVIDCLMIPRNYKIKAVVTGTLTIAVTGTLKG